MSDQVRKYLSWCDGVGDLNQQPWTPPDPKPERKPRLRHFAALDGPNSDGSGANPMSERGR